MPAGWRSRAEHFPVRAKPESAGNEPESAWSEPESAWVEPGSAGVEGGAAGVERGSAGVDRESAGLETSSAGPASAAGADDGGQTFPDPDSDWRAGSPTRGGSDWLNAGRIRPPELYRPWFMAGEPGEPWFAAEPDVG